MGLPVFLQNFWEVLWDTLTGVFGVFQTACFAVPALTAESFRLLWYLLTWLSC
ncbi:MAG: hypothetical protein ACJASL_001987 [Paraglaciecola sp.]|jgi:hypothetical protein